MIVCGKILCFGWMIGIVEVVVFDIFECFVCSGWVMFLVVDGKLVIWVYDGDFVWWIIGYMVCEVYF